MKLLMERIMSLIKAANLIFILLCLLSRSLRGEIPALSGQSSQLPLSHVTSRPQNAIEDPRIINTEKIDIIRANNGIYLRKSRGDTIQIFENQLDQSISIQYQLNNIDFEVLKQSIGATGRSNQISEADAIFGIYSVNGISYIALVTQSDVALELAGHEIREVKQITLVHIPSNSFRQIPRKEIHNSEKLITSTFNRHSFYYCTTGYDITRSYQYNSQLYSNSRMMIDTTASVDWKKADQKFFWNINLVKSFHQFGSWIYPMTNALISTRGLSIRDHGFNLTLISRRSRLRQGPRYIKRGSDLFGEVANFAETEQLLEFRNSSDVKKKQISSFVQIRGSIPIFWSQPKTWELRPKIVTKGTLQLHARALKSHLMDLYNGYISPYCSTSQVTRYPSESPDVYFVNLIDKSGGQGLLGRWLYAAFQHIMTQSVSLLFGSALEAFSSVQETSIGSKKKESSGPSGISPSDTSDSQLPFRVERNLDLQNESQTTVEEFLMRTLPGEISSENRSARKITAGPVDKPLIHVKSCLIWFDYHYKCKKGNLSSLKEIYRSLSRYFTSGNGYYNDIDSERMQNCIVRTNCVDCLDRTNVVQTTIARWMLIRQLKDLKIFGEHEVDNDCLSLPDSACEDIFRSMWCDNGDNLSLLYAGTKALKRDVTRLGKRTRKGTIDDGINSMLRYYINNNIDAQRQVGIDLLLGLDGNEDIKSYSLPVSVTLNFETRMETDDYRKSSSPDNQLKFKKPTKPLMRKHAAGLNRDILKGAKSFWAATEETNCKCEAHDKVDDREIVSIDIPGDEELNLNSILSGVDELLKDFILEAEELLN